MASEFPDTDQRNAVIFNTWRRAKGESEEEKKAHERFSDDEYQHIRDIPVFKEHSYYRTLRDKNGPILDKDGNPKQVVETYGFDELKSIVENCNKRVRETKSFAPVTAIHTGKRKPDGTLEQPEVMGFAGPYRLGMYGNEDRDDGAPFKGKWTIYADEFWFKDKAHRAREMPRRSPEIYVGRPIHDRFLDPITALGAETPALDMGIHYHLNKAGELVEQYSAPNVTVRYSEEMHSAHKEAFDTLRPVMERQVEKEVAPHKQAQVAANIIHGEAPAVQKALINHLKDKYPEVHAKLKEKHHISLRHAFPDVAQYQAAAMPGASNVAIAQPVQEKGKAKYDEWDDMDEEAHNSVQGYHKQNIDYHRGELDKAQQSNDKKAINRHTKFLNFHEREYKGNEDTRRKRLREHPVDMGEGKLELSLRTAIGDVIEQYARKKQKREFQAGQMVRFEGKSADGQVEGGMDVKIINPHSNAHEVSHTKDGRDYDKNGRTHIPTATVERPERKRPSMGDVVPAKQFEAHHHTLSHIGDETAKYSADPDTVNACVNAMLNTQIIQRIQTFIDSHDAPVNPKEEMEEVLATGANDNDPATAVIEANGKLQQQADDGKPPAGDVPPEAAEEEDDGSGDALPDPISDSDGEGDTPEGKGKPMADAPAVVDPKEKDKENYALRELERTMTARYDQLAAEVVELRENNSRLVGERNQAVRERKIIELRQAGKVFDVRQEIAKYGQASEEVFQARLDAIAQYADTAPIGGPQLLVDSLDPPEAPAEVAQYGGVGQSEAAEIAQYQLRKQQEGEYLSWEEAKEAWEDKQDRKAKKARKREAAAS